MFISAAIVLGEPAHPVEPGPVSGTNRAVAVALDPTSDVSKIPAPHVRPYPPI